MNRRRKKFEKMKRRYRDSFWKEFRIEPFEQLNPEE
jgi:hypothetical protein